MYRVVPLDPKTHERKSFRCGIDALDKYLREQATQDIGRRFASCYVAVDAKGFIGGFYTLASASVLMVDIPDDLRHRLPRYPSVPAIRMGRLAVAQTVQGGGLGGALLADAVTRSLAAEIAAYALIVDAKDEKAADFYVHHGFIPFAGKGRSLFLPLETARALLDANHRPKR